MITIVEQTITLNIGSIKELVRKLALSNLMEGNDDVTVSLKVVERGNAELIIPFPHCLDAIKQTTVFSVTDHPNNH